MRDHPAAPGEEEAADGPGMDPFAAVILVELAAGPEGMSLPRLAKRLGLNASFLLRQLSFMGEATIGAGAGPGWVQVTQAEGRWIVHLTENGRSTAAALGGVGEP
jgi:FdhD protein